MSLDAATADELLQELDGWALWEDSQHRLRIRKRMRTKSFVKVRGRPPRPAWDAADSWPLLPATCSRPLWSCA
jgi:hypothetical protein